MIPGEADFATLLVRKRVVNFFDERFGAGRRALRRAEHARHGSHGGGRPSHFHEMPPVELERIAIAHGAIVIALGHNWFP